MKSEPGWVKAVSEVQHAGKWLQLMYPKASDDGASAEFARPCSLTGVPMDKAQDFTASLTREYVEEWNKIAWGMSEAACTVRHARADLHTSASLPTSLWNTSVLHAGLSGMGAMARSAEILDLAGPNVPRGVAEITGAFEEWTAYAKSLKSNIALKSFWDMAMKDSLRMLNLAYRMKLMSAMADPSTLLPKIQNPEKQNASFAEWEAAPSDEAKMIAFFAGHMWRDWGLFLQQQQRQ